MSKMSKLAARHVNAADPPSPLTAERVVAVLRDRLDRQAVAHGRYGSCWNARDARLALDIINADLAVQRQAAARAPDAGLRAAAETLAALETTFSGQPRYGHVADGDIDADGFCQLCARSEPYDGWHERASAIVALRAALAAPSPAGLDEVLERLHRARWACSDDRDACDPVLNPHFHDAQLASIGITARDLTLASQRSDNLGRSERAEERQVPSRAAPSPAGLDEERLVREMRYDQNLSGRDPVYIAGWDAAVRILLDRLRAATRPAEEPGA